MDGVRPDRGVVRSAMWGAKCKDCLRAELDGGKPEGDGGFSYPDAWMSSVAERGGSRSDRCPSCRARHSRDARSFAAPYVDIDAIAGVADPASPAGPLGALGPLPAGHERRENKVDLASFDLGLDDPKIAELLTALETRQVAVVVAGTGTGKSTFLPFRLLVPPEGSTLRLADRGPIVVTEPRVSAAIETAKFVSEKFYGGGVGAGSDVGYRVADDHAFDSACRLLYVTDGSLINWLRDGTFARFGAIVIDEAHERSKNIDVILGLLREALPRHPHMRLIIASATINPKFFIDYYGGPDKVYMLPAPEAHKEWGYGEPLYPLADGVNLDHRDWTDSATGKGREAPDGTDLREFTERLLSLRTVSAEVPFERDAMTEAVVEQVKAILRGTDSGDILAFLPGWATIKTAVDEIGRDLPEGVAVYPLLRSTPKHIQEAARGERTPGMPRRVVVSTNVAETSLTIDGMSFVVDSGLITQAKWDSGLARKDYPAIPHSRAGVKQRWGRVGRKAPGWVFPLYTEAQMLREMLPDTPPEATRDDLEQFLLTAAASGIDHPDDFEWPAAFEQPGEAQEAGGHAEEVAKIRAGFKSEMARAQRSLVSRGAIDGKGDITALGHELSVFTGTASQAAAISCADRLGCAIEVATALALLDGRRLAGPKSLLVARPKWPAALRLAAGRAHRALRSGCADDLDLALKVAGAWERTAPAERDSWCRAHFVSPAAMSAAMKARDEMLGPLLPGRKSTYLREVLPELAGRARAAMTFALADQVYTVRDGKVTPSKPSTDEKTSLRLDRGAVAEEAAGVVAMHRYVERSDPGAPRQVLLANLVLAAEWSRGEPATPLDVAIEAAAGRPSDGSAQGVSDEAHWRLSGEWEVGARYECDLSGEGGTPALRAVRVLSGAPGLPSDSDDDEASRPSSGRGRAHRDTAADEPDEEADDAGDLDAIAPRGVADESGEEQFEEAEAIPRASYAPRPSLPAGAAPISCVGAVPADGRVGAIVVGFEGVGTERRMVVGLFAIDGKAAPGRRRVRVLDSAAGAGEPVLGCLDEASGEEVAIEAGELSMARNEPDAGARSAVKEKEVAGLMTPGSTMSVDTVSGPWPGAPASGSWLDAIVEIVASAWPSDEWDPPMVPGRVVDLNDNDRARHVAVVMDDPDEAGPILRLTGETRVKAPVDARIGVSFRHSYEGWSVVDATAADARRGRRALAALADEMPEAVSWDIVKGRLALASGIGAAVRDRVGALVPSASWRGAVRDAWRRANEVEVAEARLAPADAEEMLAGLRSRYTAGSEVPCEVAAVTDYEAIVKLEGGWNAKAGNAEIGPEGVYSAARYLSAGMGLAALVESVNSDRYGTPRVFVSLRGAPVPGRAEQAADIHPAGTRQAGAVATVADGFGVVVRLPDGLRAFAPVGSIGARGVMMPSLYLREGEPVEAVMDGFDPGNRDIPLLARLPGVDVALPEALQDADDAVGAMAEAHPVGEVCDGVVVKVSDGVGVVVALPDGSTALAACDDIGVDGMAAPSRFLAEGTPVLARVRSVGPDAFGNPAVAVVIDGPSIPDRRAQLTALFPDRLVAPGVIGADEDTAVLAYGEEAFITGVRPDGWRPGEGEAVDVQIAGVGADPSGRPRLVARLRGVDCSTEPLSPDASFDEIKSRYRVGDVFEGRVRELVEKDKLGALVALRGSWDAMAHRDQIGPAGVDDASLYLSVGQVVMATVTGGRLRPDGRPQVYVSLRGVAAPDRATQARLAEERAAAAADAAEAECLVVEAAKEAERIAREEAEREAAEEDERLATQEAERARVAAEREAERARVAAERAAERQRLAAEREADRRAAAERAAAEAAERVARAEEDIEREHPAGKVFEARVLRVVKGVGVLVSLPTGREAIAPRALIGPVGVIQTGYFVKGGMVVRAVVRGIADEDGAQRVVVALPDVVETLTPAGWREEAKLRAIADAQAGGVAAAPAARPPAAVGPTRSRHAAPASLTHSAAPDGEYRVGASFDGLVTRMVKDVGVAVELPWGTEAVVPRDLIGPAGVIQTTCFVRPGMAVRAVVRDLVETDGVIKIVAALPDVVAPLSESMGKEEARLRALRDGKAAHASAEPERPAATPASAGTEPSPESPAVAGGAYAPGDRVEGRVARPVSKAGAIILLQDGQTAWVHKAVIGPAGTDDARKYLRKDQEISAVVISTGQDETGKTKVYIAIPDAVERMEPGATASGADADGPAGSTLADAFAAIRAQTVAAEAAPGSANASFEARVIEVVDKVGVTVALPDGRTATVPKRRIGKGGVVIPSAHIRAGQAVRAVVEEEPGGLAVWLPDVDAPSLVSQLRRIFPLGGRVPAVVVDVGGLDEAVLRLDHGETTVVRARNIGPVGALSPALFLRVGDHVSAEVTGYELDHDQRQRVAVTLRDIAAPGKREQAETLGKVYPVGSEHLCRVTSVGTGGMGLRLGGCLPVSVAAADVGGGSEAVAASRLTVGDTVVARVISISMDEHERLHVTMSVPDPARRRL